MRFSSLTGKYHYIPMRVPATLPSDTLKCFSWASHLCAYQYSAEYSNETLLRSLNSLSRMQPSLLWYLVPWTPAFFIFSFPSSISPTEEVHQTLTGLPLPVLWPEHTLKAVNWGNHSTHITSFPPLEDHHPSLPDAQCFSYISSCFIIVSHGKVNLGLVTISCLEAEFAKIYSIC